MAGPDDVLECSTCTTAIDRENAIRTKTMGGLDPTKWQTLCCPDCGTRLKTIFVGE